MVSSSPEFLRSCSLLASKVLEAVTGKGFPCCPYKALGDHLSPLSLIAYTLPG